MKWLGIGALEASRRIYIPTFISILPSFARDSSACHKDCTMILPSNAGGA